jgi:ribosomal protein S17E
LELEERGCCLCGCYCQCCFWGDEGHEMNGLRYVCFSFVISNTTVNGPNKFQALTRKHQIASIAGYLTTPNNKRETHIRSGCIKTRRVLSYIMAKMRETERGNSLASVDVRDQVARVSNTTVNGPNKFQALTRKHQIASIAGYLTFGAF